METLLKLLRPLFLPLLKLKLEPPHLPEGTSLVRHLRPSPSWLAYRYLQTLFGLLNQFIGVGVMAVVLIVRLESAGVALAVLLAVVELFVIGLALVTTRVDYDLRHYLVGDRSLRVAQGAWRREEATLSYANVQNLEVLQGPLERLFGFKSLIVSTAGSDASPQDPSSNSHLVTMVGLENADELRELILGMLRHHKDSGLGEPVHHPPAGLDSSRLLEVRNAALALRDAARARAATTRPSA
ncbi:MAG: PH domain-containing protein [Myxococcales bacterium]|nr:PH domain-containing protein [Myxococcales bacterium]